MLPALIVLAVLLVAALVWGVVMARKATGGASLAAQLTSRAEQLEADVAAATARADHEAAAASAAVARAESAEHRVKTELARAADAEQRAKDESDRAAAAERRAASAADEALASREHAQLAGTRAEQERVRAEQERERAEQERGRAEAERARAERAARLADEVAERAGDATVRAAAAERELAEVLRSLDPPGLWTFERHRIARLWRDWVSVSLDGVAPIPVDAGAVAARACVEIMAAASREECGVPIDVEWHLDDATPVSVQAVLVLLRASEELIATARRTNGGQLVVSADGADLLVTLVTAPDRIVPADLLPPTTDVGWRVALTEGSVTVRLPSLVRAPAVDAGAA